MSGEGVNPLVKCHVLYRPRRLRFFDIKLLYMTFKQEVGYSEELADHPPQTRPEVASIFKPDTEKIPETLLLKTRPKPLQRFKVIGTQFLGN